MPTENSAAWQASCLHFIDIEYHQQGKIAKITINRPFVHNAFRPQTVKELIAAFEQAQEDPSVGVVILAGKGNDAFCSGGDQKTRTAQGYHDHSGAAGLHVLALQKKLRSFPKPTIAMVAGWAIGGGQILQMLCDITIAAQNAQFGQTGPRVGSFDAGFGVSELVSLVGPKRAKEIWFCCWRYSAEEALALGWINRVVAIEKLEEETIRWAQRILSHSPLAIKCLKAAFNAAADGSAGLQELAGMTTQLYYETSEAQEGHRAFLEKREPCYGSMPRENKENPQNPFLEECHSLD